MSEKIQRKIIKDRYITIRIPSGIEQELRRLAEENTRTLAAQVLHLLKQGIVEQAIEKVKA